MHLAKHPHNFVKGDGEGKGLLNGRAMVMKKRPQGGAVHAGERHRDEELQGEQRQMAAVHDKALESRPALDEAFDIQSLAISAPSLPIPGSHERPLGGTRTDGVARPGHYGADDLRAPAREKRGSESIHSSGPDQGIDYKRDSSQAAQTDA